MIGKYLERDEVLKSNLIFEYLQELSKRPDVKLEKCEACDGTGLQGVTKFSDGSSAWNGSFCELCNGTGFIPECHKNILFVCRKCKGEGCSICDYKGITDWVTYLRSIEK